MKAFVDAKIEVIKFAVEDVITVSANENETSRD